MKCAIRELDVPSTLCFGHTLQLAIQEGLSHPNTMKCLKSCRSLITHFDLSTLATTALKLRQSELQKDDVTFPALQQDVATRWNSTYFMIDSMLENKGPITVVLGDRDATKAAVAMTLELEKEDWQLLELLVECLKPFDIATKQMSAELYSTLGSVYPLVRGIMKRHLNEGEDTEREEIIFFKKRVKKAMKRRFNIGYEENCDDIIASVSHPRFKRLKFLEIDANEGVTDSEEENPDAVDQNTQILCHKIQNQDAKLRIITKLKELTAAVNVSANEKSSKNKNEEKAIPLMGTKVKQEQLEPSETALKYLMGDCLEISDDEEETAHEEVDRYMASVEDRKLKLWIGGEKCFKIPQGCSSGKKNVGKTCNISTI